MLYGAVGKVGLRASAAPFSPSQLFAAGEIGAWYDPSDLSTMFQDAAGTTPVTAVEQPVGLILDKSGRGNHASQSTSASRPVLSARVNLLTRTEEFDNAAWVANNATKSGASEVTVTGTAGTAIKNLYYAFALSSTGSHTLRFRLKYVSQRYVQVFFGGTTAISSHVNFDLDGSGAVTAQVGATGAITQVSSGVFDCSITFTSTAADAAFSVVFGLIASGESVRASTTTSISAFKLSSPDLRVTNVGINLPAYQRVAAATDYDTTGFPMYLRFDGTDDSMETGTINPGSVDKAQVFAGVRKVSGAAQGMLLEMSSVVGSNPGTFNVQAPSGAGDNYEIRVRGSVTPAPFSLFDVASPATSVLGGLFSISEDIIDLRLNGTTVATSSADMGTGNFLSYPLFIGSRAGTSLRFNGHLYSLILRFSATNLPDATIAQTETWVNGKTYAY